MPLHENRYGKHDQDKDKDEKIEDLEPYFQRGLIVFLSGIDPKDMKATRIQFTRFGITYFIDRRPRARFSAAAFLASSLGSYIDPRQFSAPQWHGASMSPS